MGEGSLIRRPDNGYLHCREKNVEMVMDELLRNPGTNDFVLLAVLRGGMNDSPVGIFVAAPFTQVSVPVQ